MLRGSVPSFQLALLLIDNRNTVLRGIPFLQLHLKRTFWLVQLF